MTSLTENIHQRISQSKKITSTPQTSRKEAKDRDSIGPSIRTSLQTLDKQVIMTGTAVPQSVKTFRIKKKDLTSQGGIGKDTINTGMNSKESQESDRYLKDYAPLSMHGLRNYTKHRRNATKAPDPLRDIYLFDNKPLHLKKASTNMDLESENLSRRGAKNVSPSPAFKVNVTGAPKLRFEDMSLNMQKVRLEKIIGLDDKSTDRSHLNGSVQNPNMSLPPIMNTDLDQKTRLKKRRIRNIPAVSVSPLKDKLPFTNITDLDDSTPRGLHHMTDLELETTRGEITNRSHRERSDIAPKKALITPLIPKDMMIISGQKSGYQPEGRRIMKMNKAYRILMHKDSEDNMMLGRSEDSEGKRKPARSSNEVIEETTETNTRKATPITIPFRGFGVTKANEQFKPIFIPSGTSLGLHKEGPITLDDYQPTRRLRGLLGSMNQEKEGFDSRLNHTDSFRLSLQVLKDNSGRSDMGINFFTGGDVVSDKIKRKLKKSGDISQEGIEPKTLLERKLLTQYGNTDVLDGWDHNDSPAGFDHSPDSVSDILMKRTRG